MFISRYNTGAAMPVKMTLGMSSLSLKTLAKRHTFSYITYKSDWQGSVMGKCWVVQLSLKNLCNYNCNCLRSTIKLLDFHS